MASTHLPPTLPPPSTPTPAPQPEIQQLWAAVARIQADLQEHRRLIADETSPSTLEQHIVSMETALVTRMESNEKKVEQMSSELKSLDGKHDKLFGQVEEIALMATAIGDEQRRMAASMEDRHKKHQALEARVAAIAGSETGLHSLHESCNAFYMTGVHILCKAVVPTIGLVDPVVAIVHMLKELGIVSCIARIQLLGPHIKQDRRKARSAIIYMTSPFYKSEAMVKIKGLLTRYRNLQDITVEDCFPISQVEEAKKLKHCGALLKQREECAKYRVINRGGQPVLQIAASVNNRFSDLAPTASMLEEVMRPQQRPQQRGRTMPPPASRPATPPYSTPPPPLLPPMAPSQPPPMAHPPLPPPPTPGPPSPHLLSTRTQAYLWAATCVWLHLRPSPA